MTHGAAAVAKLCRSRRDHGGQRDSDTAVRSIGDEGRTGLTAALPAVFLISLSVLVFEIALTRIFSIMLSYHFVFAIIAVAMFGLGGGGLLFARLRGDRLPGALWAGALTYAVATVGALVLIITLPLAATDRLAVARTLVYIALALVPFTAAGFALAGIFRRFPRHSFVLYGADLAGAALAALTVVPAMDAWGGVNVVLLAAAIGGAAALFFGLPRRRRVLLAVEISLFQKLAP
jgi:hypothetical protein